MKMAEKSCSGGSGVGHSITAYEVKKLGDELTLRDVRSKGHVYVELREIGKRGLMFFCTLCHSQCHGDTVLYEHLEGKFHKKRLSYFQNTLLLPNPWPLNDGVLFFHQNVGTEGSGNGKSKVDRKDSIVVPGVLCFDEVMNVEAQLMGFGEIAARMDDRHFLPIVRRIWCSWLGKDQTSKPKLLEHDFAVLVFTYNYNIGRQGALHEFKEQLAEYESSQSGKKRKRALSYSGEGGDREQNGDDASDDESQQGDDNTSLDGENQQVETSVGNDMVADTPKKSAAEKYEEKLREVKQCLHRNGRRQLRKQQRRLSERMCDFCQHKILQGKDVATLLNMKTKRLVCSSRNHTGAFHILHVSCLIRWILLCESKILKKQTPFWEITVSRGSKYRRRKTEPFTKRISSVFCTECQGTGIEIEGDMLESVPHATSDEMFYLKVEAGDTHRAWVEKSSELLQHCSTGLTFHCDLDEDLEERVAPLKLLRFYRVKD